MIIDRFETYELQRIGDNLVMLNGDLYVYIHLTNFELLINTENENFIIANSISGVGVSYYTGAITGVKFTATTQNILTVVIIFLVLVAIQTNTFGDAFKMIVNKF